MAEETDDTLEIDENLKDAFSSDEAEGKGNGQKYLLKERYEVDFSYPMPGFNVNGALAYKVIDKVDSKKELFMLVCNNSTAPRSSLMPHLKAIDHNSVMKLVEYGTVVNPNENSKKMGLIYQTPLGGKVIDADISQAAIRNAEHFRAILLRLLSAIETLKGRGVTHRAIRLDNLYYKDKSYNEIVLGDCLASFPAFYQSPVYETVESLAAQPEGRGNGTSADDFYAAGVAALSLYLGHDLLKGASLPEVMRLKIRKGSYQALLDDEAVPNFFANIFRGLLDDEKNDRWSYIQAYNYLEGKASSSRSSRHERPRKSITINGEKVYSARNVALAMQNSVSEAYELIKSGKIFDWIKNGIGDEILTQKIEKNIVTGLATSMRPDLLVAKVCLSIDPGLPIKIKGISVFPDGAPKAVFYALKNDYDLTPFYDLFSSDLVKSWYQEQETLRSPSNANEFQVYINSKDIGYGIDRIMYDFDSDLPCLSPLLGDYFINSATKILKALDNTYATHKISSPPYDNTLIAYIRCKMGKKVDSLVTNLNSRKDDVRALAVLKLYTTLQKKYGPAQLPSLGIWLTNYAKPIISSYNNIKYQRYLEREIVKVNKNGKLYEILDVLENAEARKKDLVEHGKIIKEVASLIAEKNKILKSGSKLDEEAKDIALKIASVFAIVTMLCSFVVNLIHLVVR